MIAKHDLNLQLHMLSTNQNHKAETIDRRLRATIAKVAQLVPDSNKVQLR